MGVNLIALTCFGNNIIIILLFFKTAQIDLKKKKHLFLVGAHL